MKTSAKTVLDRNIRLLEILISLSFVFSEVEPTFYYIHLINHAEIKLKQSEKGRSLCCPALDIF